MATVLPPKPHLDHLKKQAKDLLKSFQSGDSQICASVQQYLPRFSRLSPDGFTLHDAQHVIARQYGFDNWPALRQAVKEMAATRHRSVPIADRLDEKAQAPHRRARLPQRRCLSHLVPQAGPRQGARQE